MAASVNANVVFPFSSNRNFLAASRWCGHALRVNSVGPIFLRFAISCINNRYSFSKSLNVFCMGPPCGRHTGNRFPCLPEKIAGQHRNYIPIIGRMKTITDIDFAALRDRYGSHQAVADALGISARQYHNLRTGRGAVSRRLKAHLLLFAQSSRFGVTDSVHE
jgi:hypothetical protein